MAITAKKTRYILYALLENGAQKQVAKTEGLSNSILEAKKHYNSVLK